jgi:hypothetical protein
VVVFSPNTDNEPRDVTFDGGVVLTMRRALGFELAAARQESFDWQNDAFSSPDAWAKIGMRAPRDISENFKFKAGLVLLYQALYLFPIIVTAWNFVDDDGQPKALDDQDAIQKWLLLGVGGGVAQLETFITCASRIPVAAAQEGNALRPSPNGTGVTALNTANSASPAIYPAPEEDAG